MTPVVRQVKAPMGHGLEGKSWPNKYGTKASPDMCHGPNHHGHGSLIRIPYYGCLNLDKGGP